MGSQGGEVPGRLAGIHFWWQYRARPRLGGLESQDTTHCGPGPPHPGQPPVLELRVVEARQDSGSETGLGWSKGTACERQ